MAHHPYHRLTRRTALLAAALLAAAATPAQAQNSASASPPNTLGGTPFPPPTGTEAYPDTATRAKNPRHEPPLYGPATIGYPNPVFENPQGNRPGMNGGGNDSGNPDNKGGGIGPTGNPNGAPQAN